MLGLVGGLKLVPSIQIIHLSFWIPTTNDLGSGKLKNTCSEQLPDRTIPKLLDEEHHIFGNTQKQNAYQL